MQEFELYFKFKGDRNYVHGTDIYTKILQHLSGDYEISNIDLSFHKVINHNLKATFQNISASFADTNPVAVFKFINKNEKNVMHLIETNIPVTDRYEYNEDKIVSAAVMSIEENSIELLTPISYSNIEKVVALNKGLLNKLFSDSGKWYFTKIAVKEDINSTNTKIIKIKLVNNIGSKITKSLIFFDEKEKGQIYFSKV